MPEISSEIKKRIKAAYPSIEVRWMNDKERFAYIEHYRIGCQNAERLIGYYENCDGTPTPVISDHLMEWLNAADTRRWPMMDRLKAYRKIWDDNKASKEKEFRNKVADFYIDNAAYFTSSSRFFMDPTSMPESRSKYFPSQEKVLKRWGAI